MIRNILFDMGNVLIRFDRKLCLGKLGVSEEDKTTPLREVFDNLVRINPYVRPPLAVLLFYFMTNCQNG